MKIITKKELDTILNEHTIWLENDQRNGVKANLRECFLKDIDLRDANLSGVDFSYSFLQNADLRDTDLSHTTFEGANLDDADLSNADLQYSNLTSASLRNTQLINADLRNTNLSNTILTNANLTQADLRNATLFSTILNEACLKDSFLADTHFEMANLLNVSLSNANMTRVNLLQSNLTSSDLTNTNLSGASLEGTNLSHCIMNHTILDDVLLLDTNLSMINGQTFYSIDNIGKEKSKLIYHLELDMIHFADSFLIKNKNITDLNELAYLNKFKHFHMPLSEFKNQIQDAYIEELYKLQIEHAIKFFYSMKKHHHNP